MQMYELKEFKHTETKGVTLAFFQVTYRTRHFCRVQLTSMELENYIWAQSQGHHAIDRLGKRGVNRRTTRRPALRGREGVSIS